MILENIKILVLLTSLTSYSIVMTGECLQDPPMIYDYSDNYQSQLPKTEVKQNLTTEMPIRTQQQPTPTIQQTKIQPTPQPTPKQEEKKEEEEIAFEPAVNEITRAVRITSIPKKYIINEINFDEPVNWDGAQSRIHGRWNDQDDHPKNPVVFPPELQRFRLTIGLLRNIYVNRQSGISVPGYHIIPTDDNWFYTKRGVGTGKVVKTVDNAICFGHEFVYQYGHWFMDYLAPLVLLPRNIIHTYKLLNVPNIPGAHETLDFLDVPRENRIAPQHGTDLIYCHRLYYAYNPLPQIAYYGCPLTEIKKLIHEKLGLDGIKLTRYCCYNRNARRTILNFNEMVKSLKTNFPKYKWETIADHQSLVQCGKVFASIKLIISGNGSHFFRCFCMNKGAVAIEVLGAYHDWSCMGAIMSTGAHCISIQHPGITAALWWGGSHYNIEIDKIVKAVKYLKPYLDGGEFPVDRLVF